MGFDFLDTHLDMAIALQNGLIAQATDGSFAGDYPKARQYFLSQSELQDKVPAFVRRCRDLSQFWQWIKYEKGTYAERRQLIWEAFRPLLDYLESNERLPAGAAIATALEKFDSQHVHAAWQKALDRRANDPEGAITAARTLLETVCKHILDDAGIQYARNLDLPQLWNLTAEQVNLAPHQHQEHVFKAILGNCQAVVSNIAAIRNKVGDAHGHGRNPVKPKPKHAELVVNLAGTMASFLVQTWEEVRLQKAG